MYSPLNERLPGRLRLRLSWLTAKAERVLILSQPKSQTRSVNGTSTASAPSSTSSVAEYVPAGVPSGTCTRM